jgi:hypothetical protein
MMPNGQILPDASDFDDPKFMKGALGEMSENSIPGSSGEFGLVESNPVPLKNVFISYGWIPLLRYPFKSKSGFTIYLPVESERSGSTESIFGGSTDIWELFDINGSKLATIYLNGYQSYTSKKAPKGFFLLSEIDESLDAGKVLDKFKNLSEEEKQNLNKELFNDLF